MRTSPPGRRERGCRRDVCLLSFLHLVPVLLEAPVHSSVGSAINCLYLVDPLDSAEHVMDPRWARMYIRNEFCFYKKSLKITRCAVVWGRSSTEAQRWLELARN